MPQHAKPPPATIDGGRKERERGREKSQSEWSRPQMRTRPLARLSDFALTKPTVPPTPLPLTRIAPNPTICYAHTLPMTSVPGPGRGLHALCVSMSSPCVSMSSPCVSVCVYLKTASPLCFPSSLYFPSASPSPSPLPSYRSTHR